MGWKFLMSTSSKSDSKRQPQQHNQYKTCVPVAEATPGKMASTIAEALKRSDYAEARLDYLEPKEVAGTLEAIRGSMDRLVCTIRPVAEGGRFQGSEDERCAMLALAAWHKPFLLDVEFETLRKFPALAERLKSAGTRLLVSWHDFEGTPETGALISQMNAMSAYSRQIKIVCMAGAEEDSSRVLSLYGKKGKNTLIAFTMGEKGSASRVLCLFLGSPYTYASLGRAVAPGQIDVDSVRKMTGQEFSGSVAATAQAGP